MKIVVQYIVTSWSKRSRGGEGARRRNAVAERMRLPEALLMETAACLYHEVSCDERRDFAATDRWWSEPDLPGPDWHGVVSLRSPLQFRLCDGMLEVHFEPRGEEVRQQGRGGPLRVEPGSWVQFRYNHRTVEYESSSWTWYKIVANIGNLLHPEVSTFVTRPPACVSSHMLKSNGPR